MNVIRLSWKATEEKVHRVGRLGPSSVGLPDRKLVKAHYVLMNIECGPDVLDEIENGFRFNDAVLRHLTVKMKKAETEPSPMMKAVEKKRLARPLLLKLLRRQKNQPLLNLQKKLKNYRPNSEVLGERLSTVSSVNQPRGLLRYTLAGVAVCNADSSIPV